MAHVRLSTTVDGDLLAKAREINPGATDSTLVEAALRLLLREHRRAKIDAAYAKAYADGNDAVDEWGDLNAFLDAAVASRTPADEY